MPDRGIITWDNRGQEGGVIVLNQRDDVGWHTLDRLPPPVGTEAVCTIDWDFRYQMMRSHTALHLLCGIISTAFGVQGTCGPMYSDKARLDDPLDNLTNGSTSIVE